MSLNRLSAGVLSAFQALLVALAGLAIPLVPLTVLWLARLDLGLDWSVFYRASADIWLLGHGVHLTVTLDPALAASLGLPGLASPFLVSLAPLAFAVLTFLLAMRLGRRTVEADAGFVGPLAALITFALVTVFVAVSARHDAVMPTLWRSLTLPTLVFALGLILGARAEMARSVGRVGTATRRFSGWVENLSATTRAWFWASLVGGASVVAILVAAGAVLLSVVVIADFPAIIGLYEGIQAGPGGGAVITLGELAYIPNVAVWVASWLTGAGFALGAGSLVSPGETTVGPLPSVPLFGVLPAGQPGGGYLWIVIPVLTAFILARVVRSRVVGRVLAHDRGRLLFLSSLGMALAAALVMGVLCFLTSGSIGPGRMRDFGATFWVTGLWLFVEVFVGAVIGLLTPGRARTAR